MCRAFSAGFIRIGYEYAGLPDLEVYPFPTGSLDTGYSEVWIAVKKEGEGNDGISD